MWEELSGLRLPSNGWRADVNNVHNVSTKIQDITGIRIIFNWCLKKSPLVSTCIIH